MSNCAGPECKHPTHVAAPVHAPDFTFTLSLEHQPNGQVDVVATPDVKGVRSVVLARCRNEDVARVCANAIAAAQRPDPVPS